MAVGQLAPPPLRSQLVDKAGLMTREFNTWLRGLTSALNNTATLSTAPIVLTGLSASLATSIALPAAPAGVYRLSYLVRVRTPATVSSSIAVILQWKANGVTQTLSQPALTSNTTTSIQSTSILAVVDGGSVITYSTVYASSGGTVMQYDLTVTVEALS
jgi:hypothetical protein